MRKWRGIILINVLQLFYLLGCASEEVREPVPELVEKEVSCTFNQLDGECRVFSTFLGDREKGNSYSICTLGTCSEGNCENGKGTLSFPAGSKIEGTFKKGKLNAAGSYVGCGSNYTGTFKDNLKEKGVLIEKSKSNRGSYLVQYYDGSFQNEMRNGKGIYYSSRYARDNNDSNIYEGSWKDDVKNGIFVVYSNFNGDSPLSEKGAVLKSVYDGTEKITYINGIDKVIVEQEERDRKEEDLKRKKIAEQEERNRKEEDLNRKKIAEQEERDRKYIAIKEAKEREEQREEERKQDLKRGQYEREQNARQQKYESERKRAYQACEATRSKYSPQCEDYNRRYERY